METAPTEPIMSTHPKTRVKSTSLIVSAVGNRAYGAWYEHPHPDVRVKSMSLMGCAVGNRAYGVRYEHASKDAR